MKTLAFSILLTTAAGALLLASLKQPLWQMRMEAPQYQNEEALKVRVYPQGMHGDLGEINVLNQYIGVHVPATLPQFNWLPGALIAAAVAGVVGGLCCHFLPPAVAANSTAGGTDTRRPPPRRPRLAAHRESQAQCRLSRVRERPGNRAVGAPASK